MDVFPWIDACVTQLTQIGKFGANGAYIHFETPKLQAVFQGNNVLEVQLITRWFFLERYMCFFTLLNRPIWSKESQFLP
jgi:hypothetical protein